jgi:hypothetical protein
MPEKVDIVGTGRLDAPREYLIAQKGRVPVATWDQVLVAAVLVVLDEELIVRALNHGDGPLHSERRGSTGKHQSGATLTKLPGWRKGRFQIMAVGPNVRNLKYDKPN